ncbi:helix-turn-helix domain-containing protein [Palleronia rufa]|uniref:helix-turn-helix domain-containing protein n=1 Tax=Palleronia rufa TaxID=1530186 RepID=UPI0039EF2922
MPERHCNRRTGIKRPVVAEYHAGDTLHALGRRHELSRNPIRIGKAEAGVSDEDAAAVGLLADRGARIAALERRVGRQALKIGFPKRRHAPDPCRKRACVHDNGPVGLSTDGGGSLSDGLRNLRRCG